MPDSQLPERRFVLTKSDLLAVAQRIAMCATGREIAIDPRALDASDPRRYQFTGQRSDSGYLSAIDTRTGRRGATGEYGIGFLPGLIVRDDGRTEWEHPWDNPYQGCRW